MEKKVAIYARVSTTRQEQAATIKSQVAALESYAQEQGYEIDTVLVFLDQALLHVLAQFGNESHNVILPELLHQFFGKLAFVTKKLPTKTFSECGNGFVLIDVTNHFG